MTPRPVNQHDLWHPNPRHDPSAFAGRPFLVVEDANMPPNYATTSPQAESSAAIEQPIERIEVREHGVIVGAWDITVCHDYRGIAGYQQNLPHPPSNRIGADPPTRSVRLPRAEMVRTASAPIAAGAGPARPRWCRLAGDEVAGCGRSADGAGSSSGRPR